MWRALLGAAGDRIHSTYAIRLPLPLPLHSLPTPTPSPPQYPRNNPPTWHPSPSFLAQLGPPPTPAPSPYPPLSSRVPSPHPPTNHTPASSHAFTSPPLFPRPHPICSTTLERIFTSPLSAPLTPSPSSPGGRKPPRYRKRAL